MKHHGLFWLIFSWAFIPIALGSCGGDSTSAQKSDSTRSKEQLVVPSVDLKAAFDQTKDGGALVSLVKTPEIMPDSERERLACSSEEHEACEARDGAMCRREGFQRAICYYDPGYYQTCKCFRFM